MGLGTSSKVKILFLDIETSPNLAYVWEKYEQDVIAFKKERSLLAFSYKFFGEKRVKSYCLKDFNSEIKLVKKLHEVISGAEIICGHNIDKFDLKMANSFFAHYNLTPPSPYKTIDTLKICRSKFRFNSNHLNDLGEYLGVGKKVETGGFKLWEGCIKNNPKSWKLMKKYNRGDITLLEKVYLKLRPWGKFDVRIGKGLKCSTCGSDNLRPEGIRKYINYKVQRYKCTNCGHWEQKKIK